jgi:uncharacterized membrane protein YeaQ/YmgE (transglycosylase-associated protein family)
MLRRNINNTQLVVRFRSSHHDMGELRFGALATPARCCSNARDLLTPCPTWVTLLTLLGSASEPRVGSSSSDREGEDTVVGIDSIIIMIIVGAIAGWLAGQIVRGFGFGLLWNIVIGIVGAFIGAWLLRELGFLPFAGFIGSIVNATIGAVILLVIVGFIRR